jgi:hypothetical protein
MEAIEEMPTYAKFMKDLLTEKKGSLRMKQ